MGVMEDRVKKSFYVFSSIQQAFAALTGEEYGEQIMHQSAALACWVLMDPAEREAWLERMAVARRVKDGGTVLGKLREMGALTPALPAAAPGAQPAGQVPAATEQIRQSSRVQRDHRASRPAAPGQTRDAS